jgi:hypothetical protein
LSVLYIQVFIVYEKVKKIENVIKFYYTHSHGTATIAGKKITKKIVKKNQFIGCHQESAYSGH